MRILIAEDERDLNRIVSARLEAEPGMAGLEQDLRAVGVNRLDNRLPRGDMRVREHQSLTFGHARCGIHGDKAGDDEATFAFRQVDHHVRKLFRGISFNVAESL